MNNWHVWERALSDRLPPRIKRDSLCSNYAQRGKEDARRN